MAVKNVILDKESFFIAINLPLYTPFDLQLIIYSALVFRYFITLYVG